MSYDSSDWTGRTWLLSRAGISEMHFLRIPATWWTRPVLVAFKLSTGVCVTLSSGLSAGVRWRRTLTYTKVPRFHTWGGQLRVSRRASLGFFYHGLETTEVWE